MTTCCLKRAMPIYLLPCANSKENYLLEVSRYIVLNPVRAGLVDSPEQWRWSSYRATVGLEAVLGFLLTDWLLEAVGGPHLKAARANHLSLHYTTISRIINKISGHHAKCKDLALNTLSIGLESEGWTGI